MESKAIENVTDAAAREYAHLKSEVSRANSLVNELVEDGRKKAQRLIKRGYVAAEDCVEDTTYYIKRHPWQSVGVALGVGAGAGILAGWLFTRNHRY